MQALRADHRCTSWKGIATTNANNCDSFRNARSTLPQPICPKTTGNIYMCVSCIIPRIATTAADQLRRRCFSTNRRRVPPLDG